MDQFKFMIFKFMLYIIHNKQYKQFEIIFFTQHFLSRIISNISRLIWKMASLFFTYSTSGTSHICTEALNA